MSETLAKFEAILDVFRSHGYTVAEQEPSHGKLSWTMEKVRVMDRKTQIQLMEAADERRRRYVAKLLRDPEIREAVRAPVAKKPKKRKTFVRKAKVRVYA